MSEQQSTPATTQWFGSADGSTLSRVLSHTEPPVGKNCAQCHIVISARDAGIVGTTEKRVGAFKPYYAPFVLHAKCIGLAQVTEQRNTAPRKNPTTIQIGTTYRDWHEQNPGKRPPFPQSDAEKLRVQIADLVAERDGLEQERVPTNDLAARKNRSERLSALWDAIREIEGELRIADGNLGWTITDILDRGVANRVRIKALQLALEQTIPEFAAIFEQKFQELIERDFEPLWHEATHATWTTIDAFPEWSATIGKSLYGISEDD